MNRQEVMNSQTIHFLTKDILELSKDKDIVDRYYDVKLALDILKAEMDEALLNKPIKTGSVQATISGNTVLIETTNNVSIKLFKVNDNFEKRITEFLNANKLSLINKDFFTWKDKLLY